MVKISKKESFYIPFSPKINQAKPSLNYPAINSFYKYDQERIEKIFMPEIYDAYI